MFPLLERFDELANDILLSLDQWKIFPLNKKFIKVYIFTLLDNFNVHLHISILLTLLITLKNFKKKSILMKKFYNIIYVRMFLTMCKLWKKEQNKKIWK